MIFSLRLLSDGMLMVETGQSASISNHWPIGLIGSADDIIDAIHRTLMDMVADGLISHRDEYQLITCDFHGFCLPSTFFFWSGGIPCLAPMHEIEVIRNYPDPDDDFMMELTCDVDDEGTAQDVLSECHHLALCFSSCKMVDIPAFDTAMRFDRTLRN